MGALHTQASRCRAAAGAAVAVAALATLVAFSADASAGVGHHGSETIDAEGICDHRIDGTEWHFVITDTDADEAPESIHVVWSDGSESDVPLAEVTEGVAHYTTTEHLDLQVDEATATVAGKWDGRFKLKSGPECSCETTTTHKPRTTTTHKRTTTTTAPTTTTTAPTTTTTAPTTTTTASTTTTPTTTTTTEPTTTTSTTEPTTTTIQQFAPSSIVATTTTTGPQVAVLGVSQARADTLPATGTRSGALALAGLSLLLAGLLLVKAGRSAAQPD